MKRILFLAAILFLCNKVFCQSLTMDEISALVTGQDNKSFLELKGFALCPACIGEGSVTGYQKNKGTPDEETVVFYAKSFDYTSLNLKFIKSLMDHAKTKYTFVKTTQHDDPDDDRKSFKSYWYDNRAISMSFIIFKSFGFISIGARE